MPSRAHPHTTIRFGGFGWRWRTRSRCASARRIDHTAAVPSHAHFLAAGTTRPRRAAAAVASASFGFVGRVASAASHSAAHGSLARPPRVNTSFVPLVASPRRSRSSR